MKLVLFSLDHEIEFTEDRINILEIRNKLLFSKVVMTLLGYENDEDKSECFYLFDQDIEIDMNKNSIILTDLFNVNINQKNFLTKLYSKMESQLINNENLKNEYNETVRHISGLFQYVIDDINIDIELNEEVRISDMLKSFDVKFEIKNEHYLLNNILNYIDIIKEFNLCKILIIINLKSYFETEQVLEIYKYVKHKKINVLFIESNINDKLEDEYKVVIDDNFDDYISN